MIRIPQVRVVDEEGAQLGVMPTPQALEMAQERGFDLVEVAPMASPPVVKFLDFGQYKYELTKREKEAKRKQRSVTFKEVRLSPKIGVGDFDTKVHRAIEFLEDGDRIKVTVRFRGRELTHPEIGRNLIARFADRVKDHGIAGTDAAARRQVDAHHDGIDPQAQGPRCPGPTARTGPTATVDGAPAPTPSATPAAAAAASSRRGRDAPRRPPHRPPARAEPSEPKAEPKSEPAARRGQAGSRGRRSRQRPPSRRPRPSRRPPSRAAAAVAPRRRRRRRTTTHRPPEPVATGE